MSIQHPTHYESISNNPALAQECKKRVVKVPIFNFCQWWKTSLINKLAKQSNQLLKHICRSSISRIKLRRFKIVFWQQISWHMHVWSSCRAFWNSLSCIQNSTIVNTVHGAHTAEDYTRNSFSPKFKVAILLTHSLNFF